MTEKLLTGMLNLNQYKQRKQKKQSSLYPTLIICLSVYLEILDDAECMVKTLACELHHEKTFFFYVKTKGQISCAVTAQLISAFVFATEIIHYPSSS